MLSEEQKELYIKECGNICPYCESSDILSFGILHDEMAAFEQVDCRTCHKTWENVYDLTLVSINEEESEEDNAL